MIDLTADQSPSIRLPLGGTNYPTSRSGTTSACSQWAHFIFSQFLYILFLLLIWYNYNLSIFMCCDECWFPVSWHILLPLNMVQSLLLKLFEIYKIINSLSDQQTICDISLESGHCAAVCAFFDDKLICFSFRGTDVKITCSQSWKVPEEMERVSQHSDDMRNRLCTAGIDSN